MRTFQWNINIDFCLNSMKKMLRSKCNAYSMYRMEEHTKSLIKKEKCFDLKKENKGAAIKHH